MREKNKYSFDSTIYKLLKDEKSRAVIFKYIPEIIEQPKFKLYKFFKAKDVKKNVSNVISDEILEKIEDDLKNLK